MHSLPFRSTRRRRTATAGALLVLGLLCAGLGFAPSADAAAQHEYKAIDPVRVFETRAAHGLIPPGAVKPADNTVTKVKVAGDIPGTNTVEPPIEADAVSITVTGVESTGTTNFLTVWDCTDAIGGTDGVEPDPPTASNLNLTGNDIRPNAVISRTNAQGEVCVYAQKATHLLVDLTGFFPDGALTNGELSLEATPVRILETRLGFPGYWGGGKPTAGQVVKVSVPEDSGTQILNVTGVDGTGWLTAWDCTDTNGGDGAQSPTNPIEPDPPTASNLNLSPTIISANLVMSKTLDGDGTDDEVCIFTSGGSNLIVDRIGALPSTSSFKPLATPKRVLETRNAPPIPPAAQKATNDGTIALTLGGTANHISDGAKAVVLNVTGTDSATGYVSVYPCISSNDPANPPTVSNLNLVAGQTRPNLVITKVGDTDQQRVCLYTQSATHLIVDLVAEVVPTPPA
jgi:hypothetical protein